MNKMRVTEERLAVLIQMCNEMGIDTMKKALESSLKNELTEALLGFVMVSTSSKSSNIINENIMQIVYHFIKTVSIKSTAKYSSE